MIRAAAVCLVLALPLLAQDVPPSPGSQRMAVYLAHVARSADPVTNAYLNRARARGIASLLKPSLTPAEQHKLRVTIARELLRGGQFTDAAQQLQHVLDQLQSQPQTPAGTLHMLRDLLALALWRSGEQDGARPAHDWLYPLARAGGDAFAADTRAAIELYRTNLQNNPDDLATRWLLHLATASLGDGAPSIPEGWRLDLAEFHASSSVGAFVDVAPSAGVDLTGHAGGSVLDDFDGDGRLDLVVSSRGLSDQLRLLINIGDGTFTDRTVATGLRGQLGGLNLSHADYDNDGDRDIVVWRGAWMGEAGKHPNSLLQNDGSGRFQDVTALAGILSMHPTHSGAWADFDNDGWLDLYVGNESSPSPAPEHRNELFHSDGDGTFTDIAAAAGVDGVGFVKGVTVGDIDNDGDLDLYLSHLNGDNVLFRNDGIGEESLVRFTNITSTAGVAAPYVSFPTWFFDVDNDGWQDLFVAGFDMADLGDMASVHTGGPFSAEHPRLYRNLGAAGSVGRFDDVTDDAGLDRIILPMGANFGDLDNDGWLDAYFGTGMPDMRALLPNRMVRNVDGRTFEDVTVTGGFGFLQKGHGISFGDVDDDGDQDIHAVLGAAFEGDVYENVLLENPGNDNRWIRLDLQGVTGNRDAIGARVHLRVRAADGTTRDIHRTVTHGGSFGSSPLRVEVGLGSARSIDEIVIDWPAGRRQHIDGVALDQAYGIHEGEEPVPGSLQPFDLSP